MFDQLVKINIKPKAFEFYTAEELWTNEYTAQQMLSYHLNSEIEAASRNFNFIDRSVNWIVGKFQLTANSKIIDFGCGPGLYTSRFAKKGIDVTGVDFSKNSLEYARNYAEENGLKINYVQQNYLEFESDEKFDLITMIMCDFCALNPEQREKLLKIFKSILKPEGAILLDVYSEKAFVEKEESASYELNQLYKFWSPQDYYGFVNIFKYPEELVSLDKYTIIEPGTTKVVYNWLQYFSRETLTAEFRNCGFSRFDYFDDVAGKEFSEDGDVFSIVARV